MPTPVDTAKVSNRRKLRFGSIDEALAEVDKIVAADEAGTLVTLGNWTPGQIFAHLAAWIEYGYDGYPLKAPPWFIRVILRMRLKNIIRKGMPSGVRIPRVENGTVGQDPLSTAEGAARLRRAFERLQSGEPPKFDSPAFGPMPHDDRVQLNLRHAELHLSFLQLGTKESA